MKHHYNNYRVLERKRYTFIGLSAGTIGTAALMGIGGAAAGGAFGDFGESKEKGQTQFREPTWYQTPDYTEATGGRGEWWKSLQDWGKSGSYGANLPNYDEIYNQAAKKINQYYWGGPSSPGLMDKVKAGAARRGVSEQPAMDVLTQRTGVGEANQLGALSSDVNTQKANAIETARGNWLNSLTNLSNLKPSGTWSTGQAYQQPAQAGFGDVLGTVGTGLMQYGLNQSDQDWYTKILSQYMNKGDQPKSTQSSLTDFSVSPGWGL